MTWLLSRPRGLFSEKAKESEKLQRKRYLCVCSLLRNRVSVSQSCNRGPVFSPNSVDETNGPNNTRCPSLVVNLLSKLVFETEGWKLQQFPFCSSFLEGWLSHFPLPTASSTQLVGRNIFDEEKRESYGPFVHSFTEKQCWWTIVVKRHSMSQKFFFTPCFGYDTLLSSVLSIVMKPFCFPPSYRD